MQSAPQTAGGASGEPQHDYLILSETDACPLHRSSDVAVSGVRNRTQWTQVRTQTAVIRVASRDTAAG